MFYENHLNQLTRLRADYWQAESVSLRNLKLSQMVLYANACGKDIIEFFLEGKSENTNLEASEKVKVADNQSLKNTKSEAYLRKPKSEKTKGGSYLRKTPAFAKIYGCPFCDFTTSSPNALSGHRTGDPHETPQLKISIVWCGCLTLDPRPKIHTEDKPSAPIFGLAQGHLSKKQKPFLPLLINALLPSIGPCEPQICYSHFHTVHRTGSPVAK